MTIFIPALNNIFLAD